ncbi:hypothetical protein BDV98DRAFT_585293 [Pterulicium gracile]|uniref:Uncharacterized protein n=1 Tax=Pterulicium gracile TaxID=1884261 RepID=A0A5C3Q8S9_9AGAR|nr:hypothetical protein BDV98DRAFT_585293 [Pterula gracilis]
MLGRSRVSSSGRATTLQSGPFNAAAAGLLDLQTVILISIPAAPLCAVVHVSNWANSGGFVPLSDPATLTDFLELQMVGDEEEDESWTVAGLMGRNSTNTSTYRSAAREKARLRASGSDSEPNPGEDIEPSQDVTPNPVENTACDQGRPNLSGPIAGGITSGNDTDQEKHIGYLRPPTTQASAELLSADDGAKQPPDPASSAARPGLATPYLNSYSDLDSSRATPVNFEGPHVRRQTTDQPLPTAGRAAQYPASPPSFRYEDEENGVHHEEPTTADGDYSEDEGGNGRTAAVWDK